MSVALMSRPRTTGPADAGTSPKPLHRDVPRRAEPWDLADLRRLTRTSSLSSTGVVVSWLVASGTTDPAKQQYAVAGGVVAAALTVAGLAGWVLAGMRTVRVRRREAVQDVRVLLARRRIVAPEPAAGVVAAPVTVRGTTHRHVRTCVMVRGKPVGVVRNKSLSPCPICRAGEQP